MKTEDFVVERTEIRNGKEVKVGKFYNRLNRKSV
jgi:hypothetical protein